MFGWENALQNICKIVAILFRPQGANLPLGICFSPAFFVQLCISGFHGGRFSAAIDLTINTGPNPKVQSLYQNVFF